MAFVTKADQKLVATKLGWRIVAASDSSVGKSMAE
jgi:hypothetical protein